MKHSPSNRLVILSSDPLQTQGMAMVLSSTMVAITIATFLMYEQLQLPFFKGLGIVLLVLLTLLIATLAWKTARAVQCQAICIED